MNTTQLILDVPPDATATGSTRAGGRAGGAAARAPALAPRPDRALFIAMIVLLAVAPVAQALAAPASAALCLILFSGIAALLAAGLLARRRIPAVPIGPLAASLVLFATVCAWILFQALPLAPEGLQHPLWRLAAAALPAGTRAPGGAIGLDPSAATDGLLALLCDGAIFWVAYQLAADTGRARQLAGAIAATGALQGLFVLAAAAAAAAGLPGGGAPAARLGMPGAAGFAGIALLALAGLAIDRASRVAAPGGAAEAEPAQRRPVLPLLVAGFLVAATALLATGAPVDRIAALFGVAAIVLAAALAPALWHLRARSGFIVMLAFALGALVVGFGAVAGRTNPVASGIPAIAAQATADSPWLGIGRGSLSGALHLYGSEGGAGPGALLTLLAELGVPAALALVLACAGLLVVCAEGVRRRRRDAAFPCIGVGAVLFLAIEAADPAGQLTAATVTGWCALMGLACAQSLNSAQRRPSRARPPESAPATG